MKNTISLSLVFISLFFIGCKKHDFQKTATGLEYEVLSTQEGKLGSIGDIYNINLSVANAKDSVVVQQNLKFQRAKSVYQGDFHEALSLLKSGDSGVFMISADSFFTHHGMPLPASLALEKKSLFYIGLSKIMTPVEHFLYMNELEYKDMKSFVARKKWKVKQDSFGIMYEIINPKPQSKVVQMGDRVKISHFYYTIDEKIIEKSKDNDTWSFTVGDPQRISGLSNLLSYMREGEKARAVIPFAEAFGQNGLYPYIEPYATIIMEIEVKEIIE